MAFPFINEVTSESKQYIEKKDMIKIIQEQQRYRKKKKNEILIDLILVFANKISSDSIKIIHSYLLHRIPVTVEGMIRSKTIAPIYFDVNIIKNQLCSYDKNYNLNLLNDSNYLLSNIILQWKIYFNLERILKCLSKTQLIELYNDNPISIHSNELKNTLNNHSYTKSMYIYCILHTTLDTESQIPNRTKLFKIINYISDKDY
tara:strand:+ start:2198 stop:2806 length:609 start_codon:yes stop_codon:yes gene_type:complete